MCKKNAAEQPEKFSDVRRTPRNPKDEDCRRNSFRLKPKTGIDPIDSVCVAFGRTFPSCRYCTVNEKHSQ